MRRAAALSILFAVLLWQAGMAARADAPAQPELREAEPWLSLAAQPRYTLWLTSSRDLCTAGTPTEISWQISGGSAPYALSIEDSAVDVSADNIRINCGALTEAEAADAEAALAAKRIAAVVTDSRGVQRDATIEVQRARPLSAPEPTPFTTYADAIVTDWRDDADKLDGTTSLFLIRWRSTPSTDWSYKTLEHTHRPFNVVHVYLDGLSQGVNYQFQFTALRDRIEAETPDALQWALRSATTLAPPTGLSAAATHDTVTVTWDPQPAAGLFYVWLDGPSSSEPSVHDSRIYTPTDHDHGQPSVVFNHVPPDREYTVRVRVGSSSLSETSEPLEATTSARTRTAPPAWTAPLRGAQRVRAAATENSITVTWDAPYLEASDDDYHLMLFHPTRSGIRHERVYDGITTFTFGNLEPGLTYRVTIDHIAIVEARTELQVATLLQPDQPSSIEWWAGGKPTSPPLYLKLQSSRNLCTAGTLTEISWNISGGAPPYTLSIEDESVDPAADNIRINCGALSEAEAADAEAALAAKRITAVVTDSRGVRREAALDVARARALPAPSPEGTSVQRTSMATNWSTIGGAHHGAGIGWWLMRWRPAADSNANWNYTLIEQPRVGDIVIGGFGGLREGSSYAYAVATLRDPIEQTTPDALVWSGEFEGTTSTTPTGVRATSTHDTITVTWDEPPSVRYVYVEFIRADGVGRYGGTTMRRRDATLTDRVTLIDLEPETEYDITVSVDGDVEARLSTSIKTATAAAPTGWQAPPRGAQNLQVSATHDTITVTWDAPVPNTRDRWIVYIGHPSWSMSYARWVSTPLTVTLGPFTPETTYSVKVAHLDHHGTDVTTTITTAAAPSHAGVLPAPLESAP